MMAPEIVALFLRSLSAISKDPALGYRGAAITSALDLGATALEAGAAGAQALSDLTEQVARMAAEGREPRKDEWQSLRDRSDAAHKILNPPEETPREE